MAARSQVGARRSEAARPRVLLIEDERRIASFLLHGLRAEGFEPGHALTGEEALALLDDFNPHVVLLDLMLPGIDGLEVLRRVLQRRPDVPVLIMSARRDLSAKLAGLRAGAADYVVKPIAFDELVERLNVQLRGMAGPAVAAVLRAGSLVLNLRERTADLGQGPISLSDRECAVLEQLALARGDIVTRERLLSAVWGYAFVPQTNVLDVCVSRLRDKLGNEAIQTVRGRGYCLTVD